MTMEFGHPSFKRGAQTVLKYDFLYWASVQAYSTRRQILNLNAKRLYTTGYVVGVGGGAGKFLILARFFFVKETYFLFFENIGYFILLKEIFNGFLGGTLLVYWSIYRSPNGEIQGVQHQSIEECLPPCIYPSREQDFRHQQTIMFNVNFY